MPKPESVLLKKRFSKTSLTDYPEIDTIFDTILGTETGISLLRSIARLVN
jgi:hypothetical protein